MVSMKWYWAAAIVVVVIIIGIAIGRASKNDVVVVK